MSGASWTSIIFTFTVEGEHKWPGAKEPVQFLKFPHHHRFFVEVELEVSHDDREIEFISMARTTQGMLQAKMDNGNFADASCETIAKNVLNDLPGQYSRHASVKVMEDNIHGARVTRVLPK